MLDKYEDAKIILVHVTDEDLNKSAYFPLVGGEITIAALWDTIILGAATEHLNNMKAVKAALPKGS
jgi:hypothetical protein